MGIYCHITHFPMSEKPTGIEDVPLKKTDTPENQEQKVRKQEENQRQRTDLAAREYFKNAKTDGLTPGETSFERSMDNLALVGIDAADQSYTEISSTENFKNLPEADQ